MVEDSPLLARELGISVVGGGVGFVVGLGGIVSGGMSVVGSVVVVGDWSGGCCCCVAACNGVGGAGVDVPIGVSSSVAEVVAPPWVESAD